VLILNASTWWAFLLFGGKYIPCNATESEVPGLTAATSVRACPATHPTPPGTHLVHIPRLPILKAAAQSRLQRGIQLLQAIRGHAAQVRAATARGQAEPHHTRPSSALRGGGGEQRGRAKVVHHLVVHFAGALQGVFRCDAWFRGWDGRWEVGGEDEEQGVS